MAHSEEMARKIKGLLAQAESTQYPAEAEAAMELAQRLMVKHRIDEAMLAAVEANHDDVIDVYEYRVGRGPYVGAYFTLLTEIGDAFGCKTVYTNQSWGRLAEMLGFRSDLDDVRTLYTSLLDQAQAAVRAAEIPRGHKAVAFRRSFLFGFAREVGIRLDAIVAEETAAAEAALRDSYIDAGPTNQPAESGAAPGEPAEAANLPASVALVLREREEQVTEAYQARWPSVRKVSAGRSVTTSGFTSGVEAGRTANLTRNPGVRGPAAAIGGRR